MTTIRKIVATTITAAALAVSIGVVDAQAASLVKGSTTVVVNGGGQGNWPLAR
ncbi:MAG: hypothetical protein VB080_00145 [Propionicimonas sp.]|uniref:hypothetical protein n=1 Tax=Propionicimonas sp. TaxID=1955623 RepID=UPI002B21D797|nr:hypothetical protein [Propionicimonas sp.]MEA4942822.1 hypothetical protein [Propionicimonas sp.]MEA5117681.1 hypothetical protein [Propionicimonas sp.]